MMFRFVHDCPLLARKLESGLKTKNPRKSMKYKGIMWWPGTELPAGAALGLLSPVLIYSLVPRFVWLSLRPIGLCSPYSILCYSSTNCQASFEPPTSLRFSSYDLAGTGIFSTLLRPMYQRLTGTSHQKVTTFEIASFEPRYRSIVKLCVLPDALYLIRYGYL